jgi:hypothetical protein
VLDRIGGGPLVVNRGHPLNRGRISWYLALPGINYGGARWYDLIGSNHGTLTNMTTSASGWRGTTRPGGWGSLQTDGADDYIDCGAVPLDSNNWTLASWITWKVANDPLRMIAWHGSGPTIYHSASNLKIVHGGSVDLSGSAGLSIGVPAHVAITRSGAVARIFKDGAKIAENLSFAATYTADSSFHIGNSTAFGEAVGALFDDVTCYSRGLSEAEVRSLYDLSRRGYPGVLVRSGWPAATPAEAGTAFVAPRPYVTSQAVRRAAYY